MAKSIHKPSIHAEPEPVRRKLAEANRKRANGKRFTPAERETFNRMADGWEKTLPK